MIYVVAAYIGSAVLYGSYLAWLLTKERRLERVSLRDVEPR